MSKRQVKRISLDVSYELDAKIDKLSKTLGIEQKSSVIRYCINAVYGKAHPSYVTGNKTAEKKMKQEALCSALGGTVKDGMCTYTAYVYMNPMLVETYEQSIEVANVTQDTIEKQYQGESKERILEVLEKMSVEG